MIYLTIDIEWPYIQSNHFDFTIFSRLEASLQPNIGFTLERALTVFTRSENEPIWMKFGALWVGLHSWKLALADFGPDPRTSESWRTRRNFVFVRYNARLYRFSVAKFHEIWTQHVGRWGDESFRDRILNCVRIRGRFSKKTQKIRTFSTCCDFRPP